jgi:mRNA-degrading endonuclease YafQ of YafQ-DinJ toxin-antitoxin module
MILKLKTRYSSRLKKDFKTIVKRGYDVKLLEEVLNIQTATPADISQPRPYTHTSVKLN